MINVSEVDALLVKADDKFTELRRVNALLVGYLREIEHDLPRAGFEWKDNGCAMRDLLGKIRHALAEAEKVKLAPPPAAP